MGSSDFAVGENLGVATIPDCVCMEHAQRKAVFLGNRRLENPGGRDAEAPVPAPRPPPPFLFSVPVH